jgi:hypothetical protein
MRLWCFVKYKIFCILHEYFEFESLNDRPKPLIRDINMKQEKFYALQKQHKRIQTPKFILFYFFVSIKHSRNYMSTS